MFRLRRTLSVLISITLVFTIAGNVFAEDQKIANGVNVVSEMDAERIEKKLQEISSVRVKLASLKEKSDKKNEVAALQKQLEEYQTQLSNLGAEKPSKELFTQLLISSRKSEMKQNKGKVAVLSDWNPSEIIDQYNEIYDVWGYSTTHNGKQQYHIIFEHKGIDTNLAEVTTKQVYTSFSSGSVAAQKWVGELLQIYAEKLTGSGLGKLNPLLNWLPWELLFPSPPSNQISSPGAATVFTLGSVTAVKFVYVFDTINNDWWFALSTNRVNYGWDVDEYIIKNSVVYTDDDSSDNNDIYGNYYSAPDDANSAYSSGYSKKTCIYKLALYSNSYSNDQINQSIHSPTFVAHM